MMRAWCGGLLSLFCCAFVLCGLPAHAAVVQPEVVESGSVIVTAETAEIREGPSLETAVITIVKKGEIFLTQGRTGGWYSIKINDDVFGWISGRAIDRYTRAASPPTTAVGPYGGSYYLSYPSSFYPYYYYYPGGIYDYSYYWGPPYLSWEWYFYDYQPHQQQLYEQNVEYQRARQYNQPLDDAGHPRETQSQGAAAHGDGDQLQGDSHTGYDAGHGGHESQRGFDAGHRSNSQPGTAAPRLRRPFPR